MGFNSGFKGLTLNCLSVSAASRQYLRNIPYRKASDYASQDKHVSNNAGSELLAARLLTQSSLLGHDYTSFG